MAELTSNVAAVEAKIAGLIQSFNFTRKGEDKSLGHDMAVVVATGIQERSIPEMKAPDGDTWDPNEPKYAARKRAKYDADQPNVRTGQMLSLESLLGDVSVAPETVTMRYGTGDPPTSAANGATLTEGDKSITDIEKAYFGSKTRPFYALDSTIEGEAVKVAKAALADHLREKA